MNATEKNRIVFEEMPVPRALATLALPVMVSQLIILIYNMADTFFIGRTNNPMMVAGASLILPVYNITIAMANISGTGGGSLISRLLGQGRTVDAKKVAAFSLWFSMGLAVFFSLSVFIFMKPLLSLLGASAETALYARQYATCVIVAGGIPTIMSMTMSNLLRSVGFSKQAGLGVSAGGVLNIILDPIFMFVIMPRGMEPLAAGIATMISNVIICIYFLILLFRMKDGVVTYSTKHGMPGREELRSFFSVGIPASMNVLMFDLDYMILNRLMSTYSDIAVAAMGICLKVERLPQNMGIGLCLGMVPLTAYNFASGDLERMRKSVKTARLAGLTIGIVSVILYEIFTRQIISIFISEPMTVEVGAQILTARCIGAAIMFLCFQPVHYFQAIGKGLTAFSLSAIRWLGLNIPLMLLFDRLFGFDGLIWASITADAITAIGSAIFMKAYNKKRFGF